MRAEGVDSGSMLLRQATRYGIDQDQRFLALSQLAKVVLHYAMLYYLTIRAEVIGSSTHEYVILQHIVITPNDNGKKGYSPPHFAVSFDDPSSLGRLERL